MPIISGRSKLVRSNNCITLLCTSQFHHQGLGAYWEIYTNRLHGLYLSHHVRTLSPGPAPSMHGTRYFTVRDWDKGTRHSLRILKTSSLPRTLCSKSTYYSRIMLNAFWYPLFPKLCRHNPPNPRDSTWILSSPDPSLRAEVGWLASLV